MSENTRSTDYNVPYVSFTSLEETFGGSLHTTGGKISNQVKEKAFKILMNQHKPGDCVVLSDQILLEVISKERFLSREEWENMLASPATLRRRRFLIYMIHKYRSLDGVPLNRQGIENVLPIMKRKKM